MTQRRIFSWLALWLAIAMTALAGTALAGGNPNFTLPLHAKVIHGSEGCTGYLPVDCLGVPPTVQVQTGQLVAIFLLVANASQLTGVQTAFEIDPSWTFISDDWYCRGRPAFVPGPPFNGNTNSVAVAFNCITGGALLPIGLMHFVAGTGCVGQTISTYPLGTHVLDCNQDFDLITLSQAARLGSVCVGPGGHDACAAATPVAAATWGSIKQTYR